MCNLYSLTKGQDAIRAMYRAALDSVGNLPPLPGIFPDQMAPVVQNTPEGRALVMMRWGFPPPPGIAARVVTNVRNPGSGHWRPWLGVGRRCLVPATSFCEYAPGKPAVPHWFALGADRPLFAFAGVWRPWAGRRGAKSAPVDGEHALFAFLTTEANEVVAPVHPKAMPVILATPSACDVWLEGTLADALALQAPLPPGLLHVVATGSKEDVATPAGGRAQFELL